jgi:hypothetical protein
MRRHEALADGLAEAEADALALEPAVALALLLALALGDALGLTPASLSIAAMNAVWAAATVEPVGSVKLLPLA